MATEEEEKVHGADGQETKAMDLVGCLRCFMYVMLSEVDPKCPKCKSTAFIDLREMVWNAAPLVLHEEQWKVHLLEGNIISQELFGKTMHSKATVLLHLILKMELHAARWIFSSRLKCVLEESVRRMNKFLHEGFMDVKGLVLCKVDIYAAINFGTEKVKKINCFFEKLTDNTSLKKYIVLSSSILLATSKILLILAMSAKLVIRISVIYLNK
ncbi:unnamed protein product [Sphenostylis stenocarpa]|uniref:GIR1-like zinc ribbon domain-containing protein n=1 Tax=Sphenostylis stenocarpa TaxID=92480 RepID=A0AA86VL94_9FABA|nr:unnamed protein product [Sphenostylis stenocarpa]